MSDVDAAVVRCRHGIAGDLSVGAETDITFAVGHFVRAGISTVDQEGTPTAIAEAPLPYVTLIL